MADSTKDDKPKLTEEGQRKGDKALKRMLETPPKPHKPKGNKKGG